MEAFWTRQMVQQALEDRQLTMLPGAFTESLVIVTADSVQMFFDGALHDRIGDYYLVWTEHHGSFVEHQHEVKFFRVWKRDAENE